MNLDPIWVLEGVIGVIVLVIILRSGARPLLGRGG